MNKYDNYYAMTIAILIIFLLFLILKPIFTNWFPLILRQTVYNFTKDVYAYKDWNKAIGKDLIIKFDIKSTADSGVILSIGDPGPAKPGICSGTDTDPCNPYLLLWIFGSGIMFVYSTPEGSIAIESDRSHPTLDGTWHTFIIKRDGDNWTLICDDVQTLTKNRKLTTEIPAPSRIFFGHSLLSMPHAVEPLEACIKNIYIDGTLIYDLSPVRGKISDICT